MVGLSYRLVLELTLFGSAVRSVLPYLHCGGVRAEEEIRNIALSYGAITYFDLLNRLGMDNECDGRTAGRIDRIAFSNSAL